MRSNLLEKGLLIGIIVLFIGSNFVSGLNIRLKNTTIPLINTRGYIQDLIDNASEGDTIYIPSGIYYENIIINKSISLVGEDKNTTIIDGSKVNDVVYISANNVTISGFTIQNSGVEGWQNNWDGGIDIRSRNCIFFNNIFNHNYWGIVSIDGGKNTFSYNTFYINTEAAIQLWDDGENNIFGNTITYYDGINIWSGGYNNVFNNLIDATETFVCGISVTTSRNTISKNTLIHNGFYFDAGDNDVFDNTVNGKPLIYLDNVRNQFINESAGQIILQNCDNITIQNQKISSAYVGILFRSTNNCTVSNCNITKNNRAAMQLKDSNNNTIFNSTLSSNGWLGAWVWISSNNIFYNNKISSNKAYGIWLHGLSDNNTVSNNIFEYNRGGGMCLSEYNSINPHNNIISNNIIKSNSYGLFLNFAYGNIIRDNNITNNGDIGIYISHSDSNIINNNDISNHDYGIYFIDSSNSNTILENNIAYNGWGISSFYSSYNTIYHNNFINNTIGNAYENVSSNHWYNIWLLEGNYWDDYKDKYPNAKPRSLRPNIWDTPYSIPDFNNKDNYPLIKQWSKSKSKTIIRNTSSDSYYLLRFLERFPLL